MNRLSMALLFVGTMSSASALLAMDAGFSIANLDGTLYAALYRGGAAAGEPVPQAEVEFGRNMPVWINTNTENVLGIWKNVPKKSVTFDTKTQTFSPKANQIYTFDKGKTIFVYWDGKKVVPQSIKPADKTMAHFLERAGVTEDRMKNNVTNVYLKM